MKNMGRAYFKMFYSWVDIVYLSLGVAITLIVIFQLVNDES